MSVSLVIFQPDCDQNNIDILRMPNLSYQSVSDVIASYVTATDCELYCASEKTCCGCKKICNETCNWNAVVDCERDDYLNSASKQCLLEKPGKIFQ